MQTRHSPPGWRPAALLAAALVSCPGCGGADDTHAVSGSLQLQNGQALPHATVMFRTADGGSTYSTGAGVDGEFQVRATADSRGLPAGDYIVVVQEAVSDDIDSPAAPKIDRKYTQAATTDLQATVGEQENVFDFALEPPSSRR